MGRWSRSSEPLSNIRADSCVFLRMRKKNVQTPMVVTVSVYQGHLTEGFLDQRALAAVEVERWYMAPGVRRVPVEDGLTATLFLPPGKWSESRGRQVPPSS